MMYHPNSSKDRKLGHHFLILLPFLLLSPSDEEKRKRHDGVARKRIKVSKKEFL